MSIFAASLGLCAVANHAEAVQELSATRTGIAPKIDGILDDNIWSTASVTEGFVQMEPDEGEPSSQTTLFQVAYDRGNLYVGARLLDDSPELIVKRLTRRDRQSESDWFGVVVDSYHDHLTARYFLVNAAGVQRDGAVSNDSSMDDSWDAVWESAANSNDEGWTVEIRIPFSALRFSDGSNATWGFNAMRYITRNKEVAWWAPVSRANFRLVSIAGHLNDIDTEHTPTRLSVIPYGATSAELETGGGDNTPALAGNVGIDLQYGLTTDLTLDLSVNPDFGQVEVDQAVINLTAFETFYPEKRPFFLEGADIFNTVGPFGDEANGVRLFYSRRIGGRPANASGVDVPEGGELLSNPQFTPILAATKVSGRTEGGLSIGMLEAVTAETLAEVRLADGRTQEVRTSPVSNYAVARMKQEFGTRSYVGGMVTAVNRMDPAYADAYVGAVDSRVITSDGTYSAEGVVSGSARIKGGETEAGSYSRLFVSKESGDRFVGVLSYGHTTANYNPNDLGYSRGSDDHGGFVWFQLRDLDGLGPFREVRLNYNSWVSSIMSLGRLSELGTNLNANARFKSYWRIFGGLGTNARAYDAYESRLEGQLYRKPANLFSFAGVSSDSRKALTGDLGLFGMADSFGGIESSLEMSLGLQIGDRGQVSIGSSLYGQRRKVAWATNTTDPASWSYEQQQEVSVFGHRDMDQVDAWTRGTMMFTRNLSLQFFSQLLVARGTYAGYQRLLDDGTLEPLDFTYDTATYGDPGFVAQLFNANVILRWEFMPGSTFYAVWTQSRSLNGDGTAAENPLNVASTFGAGSSNAVMLKLSYRWGT